MKYVLIILLCILFGSAGLSAHNEASAVASPRGLLAENIAFSASGSFSIGTFDLRSDWLRLDQRTIETDIIFRAGYFPIDYLIVGVDVNFNNDFLRQNVFGGGVDIVSDETQNDLAMGLFTRYHLPLERDWGVFGEIAVAAIRSLRVTHSDLGERSESASFGNRYAVGVGFLFFPVQQVAFDVTLRYSVERQSGTEEDISISLSKTRTALSLGFQVYLYELFSQ